MTISMDSILTEPPHTPPLGAHIRFVRRALGLTRSAAARIVHTDRREWRLWEEYRMTMPPASWELFLLKTGLRIPYVSKGETHELSRI